jgi:hypothetical protein
LVTLSELGIRRKKNKVYEILSALSVLVPNILFEGKAAKEGGRSEMKGRIRRGGWWREVVFLARRKKILRAPVRSVSQLMKEDPSQSTPPPAGHVIPSFPRGTCYTEFEWI